MFGITVLAAYAIIMIAATLLLTKRENSALAFHVSDRNISPIMAGFSIAASWIWAPALFTASQQAYTSGIVGLFWFSVPNVLCLLLFIPFAAKIRKIYPSGVTLSGYMGQKYGTKTKGIYLFQLGALSVLSTGVQLLAGSKVLSAITGIPFWFFTVLLAIVAYSYSQFSGIKASVITDVIQMILILATLAVVVPWIATKTDGLDGIVSGLGGYSGEYRYLASNNGLNVMLSFGIPTAVGLISGPFGDQTFWQRTFAMRKDGIGKAFSLGAFLFALVPLGMGLIGFAAAGCGFEAVDNGMVNYELISTILPKWVMVPFLFCIISGLISTVDSNLCSAASLTTDFAFEEKLSNEEKLHVSKAVMIGLLVIGICIANIPGLTVTHLFLFYGTLRASTLTPTILTLCGRSLNGNAVFAGVLAAMLVGLPIFAYGNLVGLATWKTAGSLITVLLSGIVAMTLSGKFDGAS